MTLGTLECTLENGQTFHVGQSVQLPGQDGTNLECTCLPDRAPKPSCQQGVKPKIGA